MVPDAVVELFEGVYYHNPLWNWTESLFIILLSVVIAKVVYWLTGRYIKRLTERTRTNLDDILVDKLEEPIVFGIVIIGMWWGLERLDFPDGFQGFVNKVFHVLIAIDITWLIARTVDALISEYLVPMVEKSENDLDDQVLPIIRKGVKWLIWTLGIIVALNNAGYNVGALLAGVGIGGIAMAMAAKDFVANIFGGVTVFIDKPFRMNDRIQVGGYDGSVVEMGIRSTRIKTLAGRIVTIPNKKFTDSYVENVSMEPWRKVVLKLGMTYDTTPEQLEQAISILQAIIQNNDNLENENPIGFSEFGDFALGITCVYYIKKGSDIMGSSSAVNLEILKQFNAAKLDFAFPTQTIVMDKQ